MITLDIIQVKSVEHLRELCCNVRRDGYIALNYGFRSSKDIEYSKGRFLIYNYIDDTAQNLSKKELYTKSNIGEAIGKGALYIYV